MEINHDHTPEIVCPYCGDKVNNSYEHFHDDASIVCSECENEFSYERHKAITYSTYKTVPNE